MTMAPSDPTRVFVVDDHELVRRGLAELLQADPRFLVVGEAGSQAEAIPAILSAEPDVALLDVRLPDGSGVAVCRDVRSANPDIRCLMLTSFSDDEALFESIMAGASGYLLKDVRTAELARAITIVARGGSLLEPSATTAVLERLRLGTSADPLGQLTAQERRILELIGEGLTNREIGERVHLAEKTIRNYVSSILAKLGMQRRTQAAAFIVRRQSH